MRIFLSTLLALVALSCGATDSVASLTMVPKPMPQTQVDSTTVFADSIGLLSHMPHWAREYLSSLMRGNVDRTRERRLDLGFAVTPSYTREAGFGIGGAATALYRVDRNDTLPNPSDVFASINASLNGFFVLTLRGNTLFPDNRSRISYKVELYRKRLDFWGITSQETANNPKSQYDRRQIDLQAEYVYRVRSDFYLGVQLRADYTDARNMQNPEYLLGERPQCYVTGLGLAFEYDTRNNLVTSTRGIHVAWKPMWFPRAFGNATETFFSSTTVFNGYFGLWKGAVAAFDLYMKLNSSSTPWTMREMVASDGIRMRGYYMGSYIDNNQIASQVELRQHVWKRIGFTVWGGGATVFSSFKDFSTQRIKPQWLPNFGIGLRLEFKHNVNARIDYGFGRHTSGILFAIGEAF